MASYDFLVLHAVTQHPQKRMVVDAIDMTSGARTRGRTDLNGRVQFTTTNHARFVAFTHEPVTFVSLVQAAAGIGGTLDDAYDFGGPGAGRQINTTDGAVYLLNPQADSNASLIVERGTDNNAIEVWRTGDAHPRLRITGSGSVQLGNGTNTPSFEMQWDSTGFAQLSQTGANSGGIVTNNIGEAGTNSRTTLLNGISIDEMLGLVQSTKASASNLSITTPWTILSSSGTVDNLQSSTFAFTNGDVFIISPASGQTTTLNHGGGNIVCLSGANIVLTGPNEYAVITRIGGSYIAFCPAHAASLSHAAITLAADADTLLGLSGQQLTLDTQSANLVFAGPTSGGAADPTFRVLVMADIPTGDKEFAIEVQFGDGVNAITTTPSIVAMVRVPTNCTAQSWEIVADASGSIVVDIWKDTYANFPPTVADTITGTSKPTLSSAQKNQDLAISGDWSTVTFTKGDWLFFKVESASTVKLVTLSIQCLKG